MNQPNNKRDNHYYIGMMSGTSLDALDAVICQFETDSEKQFKLVATHSLDFPAELKADLLSLCQPSASLRDGLSELDLFGKASVDYAKLATQCVHELLTKADLKASDITAIGCHGQTVRHRPELGFSLQLVDANYIAEHTGISVISDFRRRDMAVGGQGAPLVPAFHADLFMHAHTHRVLLNLGGIANITVLPAGQPDLVTGYDTGPANLLMDAWCLKHTGNAYDESGNWAKSGTIHTELLNKLLSHAFFAKSAPKSTGREDFHIDWLENALSLYKQPLTPPLKKGEAPLFVKEGLGEISATDIQTTLVELTAKSAADAILKTSSEILPHPPLEKEGTTKEETTNTGELFVCGGGAYNDYLLARLAHHLPDWQVTTTTDIGLAPTWVEGAAFAWLARQHELGLSGNLPSVTGASKEVVLGVKSQYG